MKGLKLYQLLILVVMALCLVHGQADADTLILKPDVEFSVNTAPVNTPPWMTATFEDFGTNTVRLTMSADNLTGTEFISKWFFNFDGDAAVLEFAYIDGSSTGPESSQVYTGETNNTKADGDGYYDIGFYFPTANGSRFEADETIVYDITYTSAISVSSFNFFSTPGGGNGTYLTAAHVQSIAPDSGGLCGNGIPVNDPPNNGTCSGWVGTTTVVPEPVSSTLFLVGAATLGYRRFRKNKNKTIA